MKTVEDQIAILKKAILKNSILKEEDVTNVAIAQALDLKDPAGNGRIKVNQWKKHIPEEHLINFCLKHNIFIDSFFRDDFPLRYINDCEAWKPEENFKKKSA